MLAPDGEKHETKATKVHEGESSAKDELNFGGNRRHEKNTFTFITHSLRKLRLRANCFADGDGGQDEA